MMPSMQINPTAVTKLRTAQGLSVRTLAALAGISAGHLSRIERGINGASPLTTVDIADALKVKPAAITVAEATWRYTETGRPPYLPIVDVSA